MKISIYITSFNQRAFLHEAIESALHQTLQPSQIIVVDDCSTDGSRELIMAFKRQYPDLIHYIFHNVNTGVSKVRVDALKAVTGDYVTYMDGDDRFSPFKLEKEAATMTNNPGVEIVYSNNDYVNKTGKRLWTWITDGTPPEGNVFRETFAREFPKKNLFRMELVNYPAWKKVGFHDLNLCLYEDYDMRIRLTKHLRVAFCNHRLSEIRFHDRGLSNSDIDKHLCALDYIYEKNKVLLNDLSIKTQKKIFRSYKSWMAQVGTEGALSSLTDRNVSKFLRLFTDSAKRDLKTSIFTFFQSAVLRYRGYLISEK